ncbi:MAG: autotransporter domain-containing protein [Chlorobium sp.]|nr:MAG: autotransporter domain-containing protein [Chlorobium sp.]
MKLAQLDIQEFLLEHSARFFKKGMIHHNFIKLVRSHFFPRKVRYALMTAFALNVTPFAGANAQQFSSIVAFGDSYADIGNIWEFMAIAPPFPYTTGRFSGGTNYVDTLSIIYGISQDNYAFGGAQTGTDNEFTGLPGFTQEWQGFLASGHVIAPNALVTVNIGGNDARDYYISGGTMAGVSSFATASALNATTGINALVGAGAKTLVFTAGNVADLPEAATHSTSEVAVGRAYSQTYNNLMQQSLSAVAASGVRVEYVDLAMIESNIAANPSLYGLTYATASPIPGDTPQVKQYLFYVDGLHLTSAGFAIMAEYIANRLNAPETFASSCELGLTATDAFVDTMFDRLDLFNVTTKRNTGESGIGSSLWSVFVQGNSVVSRRSSSDNSKGYHSNDLGTTLGIEYRLTSDAMVAAAYSFGTPSLDLRKHAGTTSADANQLGLYGTYTKKSLFLQGLVSYGWLNYSNSRSGVVSKITAKPEGETFATALKGGYLFDVAPSLRLGPIAGLNYLQAHVDGYSENGDPVLTLNLNEQTAKTVLGSVGAQARYAFDLGNTKLDSYMNFTVENNFEGSDRAIQYSATSAPRIVNSWTVTGAPNHAFVRLAAGANANLTSTIAVMLNLSQTIEQPGGNDFFCTGGLKISF